MIMYRIPSGRTRPIWVTTLYSILTLTAIGAILWLLLPFIIAFIVVIILAGAIGYWWLRWKLNKAATEYSSSFEQEDDEYVDFEIIDD